MGKAPLLCRTRGPIRPICTFALKRFAGDAAVLRFFTAADWRGIHTIMLSCVIVAQPGLGATAENVVTYSGALLATLIARCF